ncbi:MAG: PQQ-binding-like beta-propeller repeat protein [Planctomycetota bacterium]
MARIGALTGGALAAVALSGGTLMGQQRVQVQIGGAILTPVQSRNLGDQEDDGPEVEMFESPNLDRFLRRARVFLADQKFREAILVLQAVVEGRTLEAAVPGSEPTEPESPAEPGPKGAETADPAQAVFSVDGRIYRPARRLCHEYLAGMAPEGLDLYRSMYETRARDLLQAAQDSGLVSDLEHVANVYFPTLAAGTAMQTLADRYMHEGRYRGAVQVLRDLVEVYPAENLQQLGIQRLWCRFKMALCLRLAGEVDTAIEAAAQIAADFPDESLRVMGELHPVQELPRSALFAAGDGGEVADTGAPARDTGSWLDGGAGELVPLWQFRFVGGNPYAPSASSGNRSGFSMIGEDNVGNSAPPVAKYGTGTQLAFFGGAPAGRAVFLENYRLRVAEAFTGRLRLEGDGDRDPVPPRDMRARSRVPAYDQALQTPVEDDDHYYAVLGYNKTSQGLEPLLVNHVVAYHKRTCTRLWTTADYPSGEDGLQDVTFLAAPTVFGERLLAPTLRRGAFELQCLDRHTGRPLWHTRIHSGGTSMVKPPGTPVLVVGSLAYVLTNAGALAAVDAFAGDLRWIRRYERSDPLRPKPVTRARTRGNPMHRQPVFVEEDLPGFLPSRMFDVGGAIVFAACDTDMLLCVDGASGEPLWMIDGTTRYAPYGRMQYLVGSNSRRLYVAADSDSTTSLVAIELPTGVVQWAREVPARLDQLMRWPGRGCVLEDWVLMPGAREVMALRADGGGEWRRLPLPPFRLGDEPLQGPNNLFVSGPWLGVCYHEGVEVYSTAAALSQLAQESTDPVRRSQLLVQAGQREPALEVLLGALQAGDADADARRRTADAAIALARDLALRDGSTGWLDRVRPYAEARPLRLAWYLARLDVFQKVHDLTAYGAEQQRLYGYMEGNLDDREEAR